MKKSIVALVALFVVTGAAQASVFGDNVTNNTTNNNQQYGGQGGHGGQGGSGGAGGSGLGVGVGVGVGLGGSATATGGNATAGVVGSGNSNVRNTVDNTNLNANIQGQGQKQGQGQDQAQSQRSSNRNSNDNRSSANNSNSNANYGNNSQTSVNVEGSTYEAARIPVATAYAPNIAPTAVCMGSSSGGAQTPGFGISLGTSWTDSNCMLLEQVRTVAVVLNDRATAAEMMMAIPAYQEAVQRRAGKVATPAPAAAVQASQEPLKASVQYQDPIIRARLGLPPLN